MAGNEANRGRRICHGRITLALVLGLGAIVALVPESQAQLSRDAAICRKRIGKGVRRLADAILNEGVKCHDGRMDGFPPPTTDCNDPSQLPARRIFSADAVLARLATGCAGAPADIGYQVCPSPCEAIGISDFSSVVACLDCVSRSEASSALEAAYGTPPAPAIAVEQSCQTAVGRALRFYAVRRIREQQKCQWVEDRRPTGADCRTADPKGRVQRALDRARDMIATCSAGALAGLDSCGADVAAEQLCVATDGALHADALFAAVYRPPVPGATETMTPTPTSTPSPLDSATPTSTPTANQNDTPTATPNGPPPTATDTPLVPPDPTDTPQSTATPTSTQTPTRTGTATRTPTSTPTPTPTATPTATPTGEPPPPSFSIDVTAYRPQTESYGGPFQRRAVSEATEESPGAGIRINGDDDNGDSLPDRDDVSVSGENDLIEVVLSVDPATAPPGYEYVLVRDDPSVEVWSSQTKAAPILEGNGEQVLTFGGGGSLTVWVESPNGGTANLSLRARPSGGGATVASDQVHFYSFTSIVIALGGESQVPSDPPDSNHGIFVLAAQLYDAGYDVHMYDEDNVSSNGTGSVYNEVVRAVQSRGIGIVSIFGYSHGGGSTYDLAERLDQNRGSIGTYTVPYTAYIDGIENDSDIDLDSERRLPPGTAYHVNYYQRNDFLIRGNSVAGANVDVNATSTPWGSGLVHTSIDDHAMVRSGVLDPLLLRVPR